MTTDAQLEAMCAQHVAECVPCDNWKPFMHDSQMRIDDSCGHSNCCPRSMWPPKYMQNPAAVIELLEKEPFDATDCFRELVDNEKMWTVQLYNYDPDGVRSAAPHGTAPTLAKAGVLALLRARGVEVEG